MHVQTAEIADARNQHQEEKQRGQSVENPRNVAGDTGAPDGFFKPALSLESTSVISFSRRSVKKIGVPLPGLFFGK